MNVYPVIEPINCMREWTTPEELLQCAKEYDIKYNSLMRMYNEGNISSSR